MEFENGRREEFDIILLNTGYKRSTFEGFCYSPTSAPQDVLHDETLFQVLKEATNVRNLYKRLMHPAMKNLFFVGFARPGFASIPAIAEVQARYVAALVSGNGPRFPSEDEMITTIAEDKARDDAQFDGNAKRIVALVDYVPFVNSIAALLGASPPLFKYLFTDPYFLLRLFLGPATVAQFRLNGPNAKPNIARSTIESYPMPLKRRLHFISSGLYLSCLVMMILSALIPLTSNGRKALLPVGFAPLEKKGLMIRLRYLLGCLHLLVLGYAYAYFFQVPAIGFVIVSGTSIMELIALSSQMQNELKLRALLTPRKSIHGNRIAKKEEKKNRPSFAFTTTSLTKLLAILGLQGAVCPSDAAFQESFPRTTVCHGSHECLRKVSNLKPIERVGLLSNGNLQYLFSSYYNQPVEVSITKFEEFVEEGEERTGQDEFLTLYDREVVLKVAGHHFCTAKSKMRVSSTEILDMLSSEPIGIGQLFNVLGVRPTFALLDAGRNEEDGSLWRTYTLNCDKGLVCEILEEFSPNAWNLDIWN